MFSGSYKADDVTFLLKVIDMPDVSIHEKERLIQSGARHYSEMIHRESPPSPQYLTLFHDACRRNNRRFASDLVTLARQISDTVSGEITIISLARAGTPVGVLLTRLLRKYLTRSVRHYSISIIRDRGIDEVALRHILLEDRRSAEGIVFVDGWTGKGVIAEELRSAAGELNARMNTALPLSLHVVADLSGTAGTAVTGEDYLIPSSILNSVISGLISRSILNAEYIGPDDFHGCLFYKEFAEIDMSGMFIDMVMKEVENLSLSIWNNPYSILSPAERHNLRALSLRFVEHMAAQNRTASIHHIKPGIGEATRVLLRRVPHCVFVRNMADDDVAHLIQLAGDKQVPVIEEGELPYKAAALIRSLD
ncbi:MAG: cysteine protease StiP family protein [Candidatus Xenobiia bacterium LiM19]